MGGCSKKGSLVVFRLQLVDILILFLFKTPTLGIFAVRILRYTYLIRRPKIKASQCCCVITLGGSLIAKDVVLSAAHCAGVSYEVVIGRYDLDSGDGDVVQKEREVPHPKYNPSSTDNDFNLIFLTRKTTADVPIVKLNKEKSVPSATDAVEVMGW
jgi:secreted trypsin-like serine protease